MENETENNKMKRYKRKCLNLPRKWSQLSYSSEKRVPRSEEPLACSWPTHYIKRSGDSYMNSCGKPIAFKIRHPDSTIDFEGEQLDIVKNTLDNITPHQIEIARYWGTGPATKQWTPIIDILIDTYNVSAPRAARILAAIGAAFNDAFVVAWDFKYKWQIARPNQFDQHLMTILDTPNHPSYPSGHATIAGCAEVVLGYFFEHEKERLHELAKECAISRLYAGVHYPIDNEEGLRLGRHIGQIVIKQLENEKDKDNASIDYPLYSNKPAILPPPPYEQVISTHDNEDIVLPIYNSNNTNC